MNPSYEPTSNTLLRRKNWARNQAINMTTQFGDIMNTLERSFRKKLLALEGKVERENTTYITYSADGKI